MKIQATVILLLGQLGLSSSQYCSEPWASVLTMVTASDAVRIFPVPPMVQLVNARLPVQGEPRIRAIVLDRTDLRAVSHFLTGNKCRVQISQTAFVSAERRIWSRRCKAIIQI
ncbi:hypothetical protein OIDMADRAFT_32232 [Oidiodendron maius Zn]|uniref:Uncharacterized protein n=1 Tax=Oidiodendron maius (strain Zn) TaxID=913774 RepID=A0A0C3CE77_OIDMZ|nr:hypothetical protein OIDMADRAFT_32232 [Oidiodendron maius Zn]